MNSQGNLKWKEATTTFTFTFFNPFHLFTEENERVKERDGLWDERDEETIKRERVPLPTICISEL